MSVRFPSLLLFIKNRQKLTILFLGTFTGASAAAWAEALPNDGHVLSLDVTHTHLDAIGRPILEKHPEIFKKIDFKKAPALDVLGKVYKGGKKILKTSLKFKKFNKLIIFTLIDALLKNGEAGKWDFAFIDADKPNYPNYYDRLIQLLRPGGVILVDNVRLNQKNIIPF